MSMKVSDWNATRRDVLHRWKSAVDAQPRVDGVSLVQRTPAVGEIVKTLLDMTGETLWYLARNFDGTTKRDCCRFHHDWVIDNVFASRFQAMLDGKVDLWSEAVEDVKYTCKIMVERWVSREGELSLELFYDHKMICVGSFSIVPAQLFALQGPQAILISRIQGGKDRVEEIKSATRAMSDVAPRAVFFALLTGVARAAGIDHVVGVAAENYVDLIPEKAEALGRQYDDFFKSLDAAGPQNGFYICDLRAPKKPVTSQKAGHRVRTRRKRQLKERLADAAATSFSAFLLRPAGPPSPD